MSLNVFDCCSESNSSALDNFNHFINEIKPNLNETNLEVYINGQLYHTDIILEEADVVIRLIRRNWCYFQSVILNNTIVGHNELINIRVEINKCLKLIVESLNLCENAVFKARYLSSVMKHVKTLTPLLLPLAEMENSVYSKLTSSGSNRDRCPIYQYFHTILDIKYYLLLLDYTSRNNEQFNAHLSDIVADLITLSLKCYTLNKKTAFVCDCNKKFWLILQLLCEKNLGEENFWPLFNQAIEGKDNKFILWFLKEIADLQAVGPNGKYIGCLNERIKANYTLLENSLKSMISNNSNSSILSILQSIQPITCNLWLKYSKIEIYQILWDYFSKRLNSLPQKTTHLSMSELVELIHTILWTPEDCNQEFELFLSMLSTHLNEHPYHWGKMKGRIYSQLGPNKVRDFNDTGLFFVLLLFVCLTKVNFEEAAKKFVNFVDSLSVEKKQSELVWKFYTSFIVRHVRENRSIESVTPSFNKMLEEASNDQQFFYLLKNFVTDLDQIVKSSSNLQLHQNLLISSWIHKYMTTCYYQDLITLLNILLSIIDRVNSEQVWCDWELSFKSYVYPTLKYVATTRSAPEICGTLSAKIAVSSSNLLSEAFQFFNNESIVPKVSSSFLCVILASYPNEFILSPNQEIAAVQSWVKICLLTRDNFEELSRNIAKLDIIPSFIKNEIIGARDPLCSLIECIASDLKQHHQTNHMSKFIENCFGQVDRWVTPYLSQPDHHEATVLRIFTVIGLAFYKIGPLLYNKHKANCPFTRLISSIILPTELVTGKTPNPHVLQAVKKTWHLFFEATIKLNTLNDPFIERTLRELVVKYVPHFAIVDSPMLKCLDNEPLAEIILEKMSDAFFKHPAKEADSNIFKSLRIINDFVQSTTSGLKVVVNKTLSGLFEVVMFHNQRNLALSVIKNIANSALFSQVRPDFEDILIAITEKHMAFSTTNYFQLMNALAKSVPSILKNIMPRIKKQVSNVERMRGVGFDKNLRLNLERLEATLLQL